MKFMKIKSKKSTINEKILLINKKIEEISTDSAIKNGDFKEFYGKFNISSKKIIRTGSARMDSSIRDSVRKNSLKMDSSRIESARKDSAKMDSSRRNSAQKNSLKMDSATKDFSKLRRYSTYQSDEYAEEISQIKLSNFGPSTNHNQE